MYENLPHDIVHTLQHVEKPVHKVLCVCVCVCVCVHVLYMYVCVYIRSGNFVLNIFLLMMLSDKNFSKKKMFL